MTFIYWGLLALLGAVCVVWVIVMACSECMNSLMDDDDV